MHKSQKALANTLEKSETDTVCRRPTRIIVDNSVERETDSVPHLPALLGQWTAREGFGLQRYLQHGSCGGRLGVI